eukprot:TRINITY_DN302_c0_g1_i1.p1 TRINITY_DN302_c0_g1~~TRINITY_DN302_c0_g1_i1.p1  ORF type:complete len:240 (+),score=15.47 TRINITY_DN302_c0_g1_i1:25-720(+)
MTSQQVKLVLLGESGVGKTSIVQRFVYNNYREENPPTIGASFMSKVMEIPGTNHTIKFQIWDTAGQEKYKSLASMYYKDAAAAILVYDITNRSSFDAVNYWVKELNENVQTEMAVAIAGNKADLIENEEVPLGQAQKYSQSIKAIFKQTSAKENIGIDDIFLQICLKLRPELQEKIKPANSNPTPTPLNMDIRDKQESVRLSKKKNKKGKKEGGCCQIAFHNTVSILVRLD